ncbi:MAG: chromate transporter [Oscillospiraceae bacterium]|nr:chromate transporter [Oscillospiraceae bacterium]
MAAFLEMFWVFFKIGLFTIGGGYAMIPMITDQVVGKGWLSLPQLIDFIAVSESTPGPFAVNIATFVGMEQAGVLGAIFTTLGVILPSFIIIYLISTLFYDRFIGNHIVQGALSGIRPAVLGLIASAALTVLLSAVFGGAEITQGVGALIEGFRLPSLIILLILIVIKRFKKKIHPILLISVAAALGILFSLLPF